MPSAKTCPPPDPMLRKRMRKAMVCGVSEGPHGPEVVVRLNAEQWLVACPADDAAASWRCLVGRAVLVDPYSQPVRILRPSADDSD